MGRPFRANCILVILVPRALPWADMARAFSASQCGADYSLDRSTLLVARLGGSRRAAL